MTSDVRTGGGQSGCGFRADGDVEAFIEDDLRTGALDLRAFLPFSLGGIAVGRGREGGGETEGRGPEGPESVISESTLAAATTDHTHRRVAKREKQKDSDR